MKTFPLIIIFTLLIGQISTTQRSRRELMKLYNKSMEYEYGKDSIHKDTLKSILLLKTAAAGGLPEAQNYLGFLYKAGKFVRHDIDSSLLWLQKAASGGYPDAFANLGWMYAEGDGMEPDTAKALLWLEKGAAIQNPPAMTHLADILLSNRNEKDSARALSLYENAARKGFAKADGRSAALIGRSVLRQTPDSSLNRALEFYLGKMPESAVAILNHLYSDKEKLPPELKEKTIAILAHAVSNGRGVKYDHTLSNLLFLEAAICGNPSAQFILAESLEIFPDLIETPESKKLLEEIDLHGLKQSDIKKPSFWFEKAAEGGITDAKDAESALFNRL